MNIFFLSLDPEEAARMACDRHVIKMILESTQLLYTAQHLSPGNFLHECPYTPYKATHKNHPSAIWARESSYQYDWLCRLALAYCDEYRFRYGQDKEHQCEKHLKWLFENQPELPHFFFKEPPQCMPDQYKNESCVEAYRAYYIGEKISFITYKNRNTPDWLVDYL
jgi:hypothetical protein